VAAKLSSAKTFWRAVEDMVEAGELVKAGGKGTGKQTTLHLIRQESGPALDGPADEPGAGELEDECEDGPVF
jgi:hypothetical protein